MYSIFSLWNSECSLCNSLHGAFKCFRCYARTVPSTSGFQLPILKLFTSTGLCPVVLFSTTLIHFSYEFHEFKIFYSKVIWVNIAVKILFCFALCTICRDCDANWMPLLCFINFFEVHIRKKLRLVHGLLTVHVHLFYCQCFTPGWMRTSFGNVERLLRP